jgi:hypothetical protein
LYIIDQTNIYLRKRKGYIYLDNDDDTINLLLPEQHHRQKSIIEHIKDYISKTYNKFIGFFKPQIVKLSSKNNTNNTSIAQDSIFDKSIDRLSRSQQERSKQQEAMFFSNYFKNLQQSNLSNFIEDDDKNDKHYFNSSTNKFHSVPLVSPSHDLFDPLVSSYQFNSSSSTPFNSNQVFSQSRDNSTKVNSSMLFDSNFIHNTLHNENDTLATPTIDNISEKSEEQTDQTESVKISINSYIQPINIKPTTKKQHHISQSLINTHYYDNYDPYDAEITQNPYI